MADLTRTRCGSKHNYCQCVLKGSHLYPYRAKTCQLFVSSSAPFFGSLDHFGEGVSFGVYSWFCCDPNLSCEGLQSNYELKNGTGTVLCSVVIHSFEEYNTICRHTVRHGYLHVTVDEIVMFSPTYTPGCIERMVGFEHPGFTGCDSALNMHRDKEKYFYPKKKA